MKLIPFNNGETFKARIQLGQAAGFSPQKAIPIDKMRRRIRILDAIESAPPDAPHMLLEDADWEVLKEAVNDFPWAVAHKDLMHIIDGVLNAKDAPAIASVPQASS